MTVPQADLSWRKSSRSTTSEGACVNLARDRSGAPAGVGDTKNPGGPILTNDWSGVVAAIRAGRLTL